MTAYELYTDGELLACLKVQDKAVPAFEELYNRYHKYVYHYLLRLIKLPELAEDGLHEVFIKLWEAKERLEIKDFEAYLLKTCRNKAIDFSRKTVKEQRLKKELLYLYREESEALTYTEEEWQRYDGFVEKAFDKLTPQSRKVYELCRMQGMTYKEAAKEMHISPHTVKEYMCNALAILKKYLNNIEVITVLLMLFQKER